MLSYTPAMNNRSRHSLWRPTLPALAVTIALAASACDSVESTSSAATACEGGACDARVDATDADAGSDAGSDATAMSPEADAAIDATAPQVATEPERLPVVDAGPMLNECQTDEDCTDHLYCNGIERCSAVGPDKPVKRCASPEAGPCGASSCDEGADRCDCSTPDRDQDSIPVEGCAKQHEPYDCDDSDGTRNPLETEQCDPDDPALDPYHDEDCNPNTTGAQDLDADGYSDQRCGNHHAFYVLTGTDCNDEMPEKNPGIPEVCDNFDNDCDGDVDESPDGTPGGQQMTYYRDADGDQYGSNETLTTSCRFPPPGWTFLRDDCRDDQEHGDDPRINPAAINPSKEEVCDGIDNDCDPAGAIDKQGHEDTLLFDEPYDGITKFVCQGTLGWAVETCPDGRDDCNSDYRDACETVATTLTNCHACGATCSFACGLVACDEIEILAAGRLHTCAITSEGNVACWGQGAEGQLGFGTTASATAPRRVPDIEGATGVTAGIAHTCVVAGSEHTAYCWGRNSSLELGSFGAGVQGEPGEPVKPDPSSLVPIAVPGIDTSQLDGVVQIAAAAQHTCAVLATGEVACWGLAASGRLGSGAVEEALLSPGHALREVTTETGDLAYRNIEDGRAIAAGRNHTCLLTTRGTVDCWGTNANGQLAADPMLVTESAIAREVPGIEGATAIAAGDNHTCVLLAGAVYCWGANNVQQLGRPAGDDAYVPMAVDALPEVHAIAAGAASSCVVDVNGDVYCWGANNTHQLGPSEEFSSAEPVQIEISGVSELVTGNHVCARAAAKQAFCWGSNIEGQLADGTTSLDPRVSPHPIKTLQR